MEDAGWGLHLFCWVPLPLVVPPFGDYNARAGKAESRLSARSAMIHTGDHRPCAILPLCSEFTAQKRRRPEGRFTGPVHLFCQQNTRRSKLHIACSDFFKSQSALIALLLLSKSNPLRWASIWFWAQSRKKIDFTHLLHDKLTDRQGVGLSIFIYRMQKLVAPQ